MVPIVGAAGLAGGDLRAGRGGRLPQHHGPDVPQRDVRPRHPAHRAQPAGPASAAGSPARRCVVVAEQDNIAPVKAVHRVGRAHPSVRGHLVPVGHFDIYVGEIVREVRAPSRWSSCAVSLAG